MPESPFNEQAFLNCEIKESDEEDPYEIEDEAKQFAQIIKYFLMGFKVVMSDDHHLLLDIDTRQQELSFRAMFEVMQPYFSSLIEDEYRSKSGNLHVIIFIAEPQSLLTRIALQSILCSDPIRDMLSLKAHLKNGLRNPVMLFQPPLKRLEYFETAEESKSSWLAVNAGLE